jgi:hypothetical protein
LWFVVQLINFEGQTKHQLHCIWGFHAIHRAEQLETEADHSSSPL